MTDDDANGIPDLVSTIIPVYNRPEMLRQAVETVLAQTWPLVEIIISDDGSTDSTGVVASQLEAAHPGVVRCLFNANRGPGPARESGRCVARGEFIQYLDSDDRLLPRKFEVQIAALRKNSDCGIAYGYTRLIDSEGRELAAPFKWTAQDHPHLFPGLLVDRWWCTHTPLYRRAVTNAIGPWSDLRYSQDWEYDARAGALGVRLINCHENVSEHRHHSDTRQTGSGRWLSPADQVQFFETLYHCARNAAVGADSREMRHFARWIFSQARKCAEQGDSLNASRLCSLAVASADDSALDVRAFRLVAAIIGWTRAARIANAGRQRIARPKGANSINQSWVADDEH